MFHARIMFSLLLICLLPTVSHQYTIAVQGRLDVGDHISGFLKDMYNRLLSIQGTEQPVHVKTLPRSPGNAMRLMSTKSSMLHVFGSHVGKREGEKPVNNINVK